MSSFRVYYTEHGPDIISNALRERNVLNWHLPNEEGDLAAFGRTILSEALDRIYESWLDTRRSLQAREMSGSYSRLAGFNDASSAMESPMGDPLNLEVEMSVTAAPALSDPGRFPPPPEPSHESSQIADLENTALGVENLWDYSTDPFCLSDGRFDFGSQPDNCDYDFG
jgi:hypothetical protein